MSTIYDRFDAATRNISAYAILKDGHHVANIVLKYGNAVTAYVHYLGLEMTAGRACGGGYDRASAAVIDAARKTKGGDRAPKSTQLAGDAFVGALIEGPESAGWHHNLAAAGFTVCNVTA